MTEPGSAVRALLLDDNEGERRSMGELLQSPQLDVVSLQPESGVEVTATHLAEQLATDRPNVFLLDYRLDDRQDVEFRGGSVASLLKEHHPTVPVGLFTTDEKLHAWVETRPGMEDLFDFRLLKGDVVAEDTRDAARQKIIDIGQGWAEFTSVASSGRDSWDILADVMKVDRDHLDVFARVEANPPHAGVAGSLALWLLNGPLKWPGPLQDENDTRVTLGLTSKTFSFDEVAAWLEPTAYAGPFAQFGSRWWSADVRERLAELTDGRSADAAERASALSVELAVILEPEGCTWCGGFRTVKACSLCHGAVDAAHSLRRLTDRPPPWAETPLVCFHCVADGTADDVRLAPGSEDLVEGLKDGSIKQPAAG